MLEQQPPVFVNPWDNQSSFRFPPASSPMESTSTTGYQQQQPQQQQQLQPQQPISSSSSSGYEPLNEEDEEPVTGDTPYWLGGPLTDEFLEPTNNSSLPSPTIPTTTTTNNNNNNNNSPMFMNKEDQEQYQKREGELLLEHERMMNSQQQQQQQQQMESVLPYRRHSLAHEPLIQQRKSSFFPTLPVPAEKRASFSAASSTTPFMLGQQTPWMSNNHAIAAAAATAAQQQSTITGNNNNNNDTDRFGGINSIWSTTKLKSSLPTATTTNTNSNSSPSQQQQQQQQQQSLLWEYSLTGNNNNKINSSSTTTTNNNFSPSPTASSSTSSQSLFPSSYAHLPRFTLGDRDQQPPLRAGRRLSLSPLPTTSEDSVQEHFNPRDMLSSVPEEPGFLPYRRHSLAGPLLGVATSRNNNNYHTSPSYLEEQRQQQRQLDKFLPSNLLSSDILDSLDHHHHHQSLNQQHLNQQQQLSAAMSWCMVEFKAGRSEIYYSTIPVEKEDWVIVEADRGRDLGKVVAKDLPADQVALLLQSTQSGMWEDPATNNSNSGVVPSPPNATVPPAAQAQAQAAVAAAATATGAIPTTSRSTGTSGSSPPTTPSTTSMPSPKRICRLATTAEITLLVTKRQDEQKALLICQTKSKQKKLLMDIVDAEYQWDRRKLTFYFVAERRVDFRELVRDLFKIYKTRIWMCSVNTVGKKQLM